MCTIPKTTRQPFCFIEAYNFKDIWGFVWDLCNIWHVIRYAIVLNALYLCLRLGHSSNHIISVGELLTASFSQRLISKKLGIFHSLAMMFLAPGSSLK